MAELAQAQKLRRIAKKFKMKIHKLTGRNLYLLVDCSLNVVTSPPITLSELTTQLKSIAPKYNKGKVKS